MPFFFRIIAKNSMCDELPEVSLRRSPTTTLPNVADETLTKKKSVSFKEEVESIGSNNNKVCNIVSKLGNESVRKPSDYPPNAPRIETIKLKLDVSNNNVSIIKNSDSSSKSDIKQKQRSEKKEKKNKLEKFLPKYSVDNEMTLPKDASKDEYEFDDEIDQQKLGFLNTFQLTAKKILGVKIVANSKSESALPTNSKNNFLQRPTENIHSKRKSKEPVKTAPKKYRFHEMKSVGEGNKFLFTKTGDGHEISFDLSPKPLGSKPPLSKVKNDIMLAQQRADAKANKDSTKTDNKPSSEQPPIEKTANIMNQRNIVVKPKKLPMLLPKQPSPVNGPTMAPTSMSPTAFIIKKPEARKDFSSNEISVTKINEQNHHLRVYGPKSQINKAPVKDIPAQIKTPDGFAQPLPPKMKTIAPSIHSQNILKPYGFPIKMPKNIPENMQTPYGCRTPFYVPSSPSYTPNFDPKPQFKYANPNAYATFMQQMFCPAPPAENESAPLNSASSSKPAVENPRKRISTDTSPNIPAKRKSPSPTKTETDSKAISILNKINFPSSLSVTLTNEQEENKKEQLRSQKQNIVNNNIEIIKLSEEKDSKASAARNANTSPTDKKVLSDKKQSETKKLSPIMPALVPNPNALLNPSQILPPPVAKALTESKESFQRAFLESLMTVASKQNVEKISAGRKKETNKLTDFSARDDKDKVVTEVKTDENKHFETQLKSPVVLKNFSKLADASQTAPKKNLSLTPPPLKTGDKVPVNLTKSLTPPPIPQDPMFASNAAQAMQFNLMLNALNVAAKSPHFSYPDYANIQRTMLLETLRQNVEKSSALLAMHHQIQQQQQNQKSPHSPSSSASSPSSKH